MSKNIVYLDYSATTKPDQEVLACFDNVAQNYFANPNSSHTLGTQVKKIVDDATQNIADYFAVNTDEIIFTSGASEANNLAIKGIIENSKRKQIITTSLEHSSVFGPIGYLQKKDYKIDFVNLEADGTVDLNHLKSLISNDTLLVTIAAIDSEVGIRQPIEEIGLLLKADPEIYFHSDITQCVGKTKIDLTNVHLASFSGHKMYCFKGIGGLIKKEKIKLTPLIHGGKSTTVYRSGTPQTELIVSLSESFNLFKNRIDEKYQYVENLNNKLRQELLNYKDVVINSNEKSIPHILNLSVIGRKADDTQKYFAENNIFISTKTACASDTDLSKSILSLTNDEARAASSVRISLSYQTTSTEIDEFVAVLKQYLETTK